MSRMSSEIIEPRILIDELTDLLKEYVHTYYNESVSLVTDEEFDIKMRQLRYLENLYPQYRRPDSPNYLVPKKKVLGETVSCSLPFTNSKTFLDQPTLYNYVKDQSEITYSLYPNGVVVELVYSYGVLVKAAIVHRPTVGTSILTSIIASDIPKVVPLWSDERLIVFHGVVYVTDDGYSQIVSLAQNTTMLADELLTYGTEHDLVKAVLLLDYDRLIGYHAYKEIVKWLRFYPVRAHPPELSLEKCPFDPIGVVRGKPTDFYTDLKRMLELSQSAETTIHSSKAIAVTTEHGMVLYTIPKRSFIGTVVSVEYRHKRTGELYPVLVIEDDHQKREYLCHHLTEFKELCVTPGTVVECCDEFPLKGLSVLSRTLGQKNVYPTHCPQCKTQLLKHQGCLFCTNPGCLGTVQERLKQISYLYRLFLSPEQITRLLENKVTTLSKLVRLTYQDLVELGFQSQDIEIKNPIDVRFKRLKQYSFRAIQLASHKMRRKVYKTNLQALSIPGIDQHLIKHLVRCVKTHPHLIDGFWDNITALLLDENVTNVPDTLMDIWRTIPSETRHLITTISRGRKQELLQLQDYYWSMF